MPWQNRIGICIDTRILVLKFKISFFLDLNSKIYISKIIKKFQISQITLNNMIFFGFWS